MVGASSPGFPELHAPAGWSTVDFLSDLHLHADEPGTADAFRAYLAATPADAVFILGDLFEAWVGDDAAAQPGFAADCADLLAGAASQRDVHFMAGNRDFLVGDALAARCGFTRIDDPTVLVFGGRRWLLSHGDLLCVDDTAYQQYRAQVHAPAWKSHFLAKPLVQREAMARQMREASRSHQRSLPTYADVDAPSACQWLREAAADTLIHGHTHHPAEHDLAPGLRRIVLSDWDLQAQPPRAQVLRLSPDGMARRIDLA